MRNVFQRDRDRIVHSAAFRRLEYKTQVFVNHEGDHYRTRLTHSLEVAQIARAMARCLGLCEDLAEALALVHDVGHPPFGHAGEHALNEAMKPYGGFDANAQTIKILTSLEVRYAGFDGLNLCWETLEGTAKHNGPMLGNGKTEADLPAILREYNQRHDLRLHEYASAEAQIASLSDDIAYNNHDMDDGLRAGLFMVEDLVDIPVVGSVFKEVATLYKGSSQQRLIHEALRRIIDRMVKDVIHTTQENIARFKVETAEDIRHLNRPLVGFSEELQACNTVLKNFLMDNMYRHYKVCRMTSKAKRVVKDLFALFMAEPECLPLEWRPQVKDKQVMAETVTDYIAGMTDRFAIQEHQRLFDLDTMTKGY